MSDVSDRFAEAVGPSQPVDMAGVWERVERRRRRQRVAVVAATVVAVLVVGGASSLWSFGDSREGEQLDVVGELQGDGWRELPTGPADDRGSRSASVVWTGEELIVWGGESADSTDLLATGAAWDPVTDRWRTIADAPIAPRARHAAVWTGAEMVICCGSGDPQADNGAYDPADDSWRRLEGQSEMETIRDTAAVWADGSMVVVGGTATGSHNAALLFDPIRDQWREISQEAPMEIGANPLVFWTGLEVMVVPRPDDTFSQPAAFDPLTGFWTALEVPPPLLQLDQPSAVWTGFDLLLWGTTFETDGGDPRVVGARLDPTTGAWTPMADAPLGAAAIDGETAGSSSAVWDAARDRMIVYAGGYSDGTGQSGVPVLAYHPATDTWQKLPSVPDQGPYPTLTIADDLLIIGSGPFYALDLSQYPPPAVDAGQGVFGESTGLVLVSDDGLGGAQIIDLDGRRVVRRVLDGQGPGDQPFRLTPFGDGFLVGWGEIHSWDPETATSTVVADSTIYLPAAEPDRVWLVDWSGGRIGAGNDTYRYMDTDGTVLFEGYPTALDEAGYERWFPQEGVPGGLVFQTDRGLAIWDAATGSVTATFDVGGTGFVSDVDGNRIAWYEDGSSAIHLSSTDGGDAVIEPPPGSSFALDTATFSPDGSTLAISLTGSSDQALMLIDIADQATTAVRGVPIANDWGGQIAWGPEGDQLFIIESSYRDYRTRLGRWTKGSEALSYATLPFGGVIRVESITPARAQGALAAPDVPREECDLPQADEPAACAFRF